MSRGFDGGEVFYDPSGPPGMDFGGDRGGFDEGFGGPGGDNYG